MRTKGSVSRVPGAFRRALVVLLLGALSALEPAFAGRVDPGEIPRLGPNDGLMLVEVDTVVALDSVRVKQDGHFFDAGVLKRIDAGKSAGLYVVPAGSYQWAEINTSWETRFDPKDDPEYHFTVEPGKITYAGDLVFRPTGVYSADIQVRNRGLRAMDWLETNHPALAQRYAFAYSGHYPDPFPDFYHQERAASTAKLGDLDAVDKAWAPAFMPLSPKTLWRGDRVTDVVLNPAGDLLAEALVLDDKHAAIDLIDIKAGSAMRLMVSPAAVRSLLWTSDRVLIGGVARNDGPQLVTVFRIGQDAAGKRSFQALRVGQVGEVGSAIANDPDHVLYEVAGMDRGLIQRLDIHSQATIDAFRPISQTRLNTGVDKAVAWWADGLGRLSVAIARSGDSYVLMHREGKQFVPVLRLDSDTTLQPLALSMDGSLIYALSDEGRGQRDLVVFDTMQKRITRTLFTKPGVDVTAVLVDDDRNPIAVNYYQEGRKVTEYFDAKAQSIAGLLQQTFPGRSVEVEARNRDGSQLVLQVQSSDQPPMLYLLDVAHRQASLLDPVDPWFDKQAFAPTRLLKVTSKDGLPIEAYLTLPTAAGRHPLVVLPHGGPVGVSDHLMFDRETQFFASLGYAVLRVNFRGSDGYGRAFREAGYHAQGTRIEDDIDASITAALAAYPLDADRMCIVGSSYGGYSALVSTMRWPHRFRCAVSISGVSDRMLFFTASDGGQSREGRKSLERVVGDPVRERDEMMAGSPIYHYRDLQVPLMLVHGKEDERVDYEHARRLVRMLNLSGHKPVMITFKEGTHAWDDVDQIDKAYAGIAAFLEKYLGAPGAPAASATSPSTSVSPTPATVAVTVPTPSTAMPSTARPPRSN
ncbi:alpha/beta hydrolase family protein [Cognatiluteimonas profundi]|uniref:alpha/beta hydrolase family protein n=1 Tax=Cognatiluteimonas profundi TaxID=2594501 RepID=UPI00131CDA5D|nr:prolyl oligopeptidase family serine peptidase [Lysobacter profundi]